MDRVSTLTRTSVTPQCDMLDPLSLFAMEATQEASNTPSEVSVDTSLETSTHNINNRVEHNDSPVSSIIEVDRLVDENIALLNGERLLMKIPDLLIQLPAGKLIPGVLHMTTYRMSFVPSPTHLASLGASNPSVYSLLNVPLSCIDRIEKEKRQKDSRVVSTHTIIVSCKDVRQHRIIFDMTTNDMAEGGQTDADVDRALSAMCAYAFPNSLRYLFAFAHAPVTPPNCVKLGPFDFLAEMRRLGVSPDTSSSMWRISHANRNFRLCNSYPKDLVVPARLSDEDLFLVAGFRSGQRLPAMTWLSRDNGASIWRSSQPKGGVSGSCLQDEVMLDIIACSCNSNASDPMLMIFDCRPRTSAMANRAAGAGYENQANYPNTRLEFMNIGNIHVMRESFKNLASLFLTPSDANSDVSFGKQLEDTQWLSHVRLVLRASWECARTVHKGTPALIHCSHGWDRTSQVAALAQIFLDPFYRTIAGFRVLVEKDWIAFGHPFQKRCAHGFDKSTRQEDEMSPIFLQFLDCMFQLINQFPQYFEYSQRYILTIADHIYSCRFGNFIGNSESEREQAGIRSRSSDLWNYLEANKHLWLNPLYMDPESEDTPTTRLFLPHLSQMLRNVTLWTDYYHRWSVVPTMLHPPEALSKHIHTGGVLREYGGADDTCTVDADYAVPAMSTSHDYWEALYRKRDAPRCSQVSAGAFEPRGEILSGASMADFLSLMDAPIDDSRLEINVPAKVSPTYSPVDSVDETQPPLVLCNATDEKHYKNVVQLLRVLQDSNVESDLVKRLLGEYNIAP